MLKSAVLFGTKPLHFHIFAEDHLHQGFKDGVSSEDRTAEDNKCLNKSGIIWRCTVLVELTISQCFSQVSFDVFVPQIGLRGGGGHLFHVLHEPAILNKSPF